MAKGMSIHIGLNRVDPEAYNGWDGQLMACEADAEDMAALAEAQGFEGRTLLTAEATSAAILAAVRDASGELSEADILLMTYSGHGGQVPDSNSEEEDRMDETWVAYDRQIVDDELYNAWSQFQSGVRIALLSDSCHSGTVAKAVLTVVQPDALKSAVDLEREEPQSLMKAIPAEVARSAYEAHKDVYEQIQRENPAYDAADIDASVLLLSGCQDNQTSADGQKNGLFTQTLLEVWDGGQVEGSYKTFAKQIVKRMPPWQTPNLFTAGAPNQAFEGQHPFTV
jgi:hypothetical protein